MEVDASEKVITHDNVFAEMALLVQRAHVSFILKIVSYDLNVDRDPCKGSTYCLNGSRCIRRSNYSRSCSCLSGFSGSRCDGKLIVIT